MIIFLYNLIENDKIKSDKNNPDDNKIIDTVRTVIESASVTNDHINNS